MNPYRFFDYASTSPCCEQALQTYLEVSKEHFANPSSSHTLGQKAARVIREAREFFASHFQVEPEQVIFTGSGTEANNLAIFGPMLHEVLAKPQEKKQVLFSSIEHASVRNAALSLQDYGVQVERIQVSSLGEITESLFKEQLQKNPSLVSVQTVNQLIGTLIPVEKWAQLTKSISPHTLFHTDAIQALGRVPLPQASSSQIDLLTLSAHKVQGPKGVGALIVLNRSLVRNKKLRPLLWGGGQEKGMRSGTQNPALISSFYQAARIALQNEKALFEHVLKLRDRFKELIFQKGISGVRWNSPEEQHVPHILNLSFLGIPAAPLAGLLEEKKCIVSVGSACHSKKPGPDPVLAALGLPLDVQNSALRISFSSQTQLSDVEVLAEEIAESVKRLGLLLGRPGQQSFKKQKKPHSPP